MKIKTSILPLFTVSTGVLGMIFRFWLNTAGTDKEGLVIQGHPSVALMFIVAAATLLVVGVCAWGAGKKAAPFPRSIAGAAGCFVAALGILISDFMELAATDGIVEIVCFVFGLLATGGFVYAGFCRLRGKACKLLAHIPICLYFMVHLVMQYQGWAAVPQLHDYFFPLLASVFLMLCAYNRACKDLLQENEGAYLFFSQAALFCSLLSLTGSSWLFYASMAVFTTLDLFPRKEN